MADVHALDDRRLVSAVGIERIAMFVLPKQLPHMPHRSTRMLIQGLNHINRRRVIDVTGVEHLRAVPDPFVAVLNHSAYPEALLLPSLLSGFRHGRMIRFMADWNFLLIPGVSQIFRIGRVIPVVAKPARPAALNRLRPFFMRRGHGFRLARVTLEQGASVGIFPEGTVNRDPLRLAKGHRGAARLAVKTAVPVLPVGVRYPQRTDRTRALALEPMEVHIGAPMWPASFAGRSILDIHGEMMRELARLSGKQIHKEAA